MSNGSIENVYNKALKFLERRQHSVAELKRKLESRGYNEKSIVEALAKLAEQDYLNDGRFAEVFLDNLIRYKTFGFYGLKARLLQRGIDSSDAETLLKERLPFERELEVARRILDKSSHLPKAKIAQRLSRKGFRNDVIRTVLQDFC